MEVDTLYLLFLENRVELWEENFYVHDVDRTFWSFKAGSGIKRFGVKTISDLDLGQVRGYVILVVLAKGEEKRRLAEQAELFLFRPTPSSASSTRRFFSSLLTQLGSQCCQVKVHRRLLLKSGQ